MIAPLIYDIPHNLLVTDHYVGMGKGQMQFVRFRNLSYSRDHYIYISPGTYYVYQTKKNSVSSSISSEQDLRVVTGTGNTLLAGLATHDEGDENYRAYQAIIYRAQ